VAGPINRVRSFEQTLGGKCRPLIIFYFFIERIYSEIPPVDFKSPNFTFISDYKIPAAFWY